MRTSVTFDPDVHTLLKEAAQRSGRSLKTTLDDAIRAGLKPGRQKSVPPPNWRVVSLW
jgi:TraY domain